MTDSSFRIAGMTSLFDSPQLGEQLQLHGEQLVSGTAPALVSHLTSPDKIDYELLLDFFMTYREFFEEGFLLELLLSRFLWSLSTDESDERNTVKQLVTLRTFVTLRHWLLNYFQDDFVENVALRRQFVDFMNDLSERDNLLKDPQSIGMRCFVDLKKAYIRLCSIFWSTIELEKLDVDFSKLKLNSYDDMVRLSVIGLKQMTNPAKRRSGILSLYDQQGSSATNLLLREHAQRSNSYQSIKQRQRLPLVSRKFKRPQTQPMLHPKDSLLTLNKTRKQQDHSHVKGVVRLSGKWDEPTTTRGEVQVFEDSQVRQFAPGTPLKKMEYEPLQPIKSVELNTKKRGGLFRFKSKKQATAPVTLQQPPAPRKTPKEQPALQLGSNRIDLLSAQVIDEFENLLSDSTMRNRLSEHLIHGRKASRSSAFSLFIPNQKTVLHETVHETNASFEETKSITSSQILEDFNKDDDTFKSPSVTMNWSNSLDLSNESPVGNVLGEQILSESDDEAFMSSFEEQPEDDKEPVDLGDEILDNRFSVQIIPTESRSSSRSYVSYDSDISRDFSPTKAKGKGGYALLRKKTSFSNLRDFQSEDAVGLDTRDFQSEDAVDLDNWNELPYHNVELEGEFDVDDIDLPDFGDDVSMFSSTHSSSFVLPYPGFSSGALAELAAIPDEPSVVNPIEAALLRLEGKQVEGPQVIYGLNDEVSDAETEQFEDTDSGLNEDKLQEKVRDLFIQRNPALPSYVNGDDHTLGDAKFRLSQNDFGKLPKETFSLEKVMEEGIHISFILCYDSKLLAQHFTQIEKDALQEIDWRELVEMKWNQEIKPINSWLGLLNNELDNVAAPGVNLVISRFNLMSNWIVSEILLTKSKEERVMTISRFIHIAHHCKELQNFSTMIQITLALSTTKISSLKETWKSINAGDLLLLKSLKDLTSPFRNFSSLRQEIDSCTVSKGVVPFVGLYLTDLTFNQERPAFLNSDVKVAVYDDFVSVVNFQKFRMNARIVKSLIRLIEISKLYDFNITSEILSKCIYIKSLTEEQMEYCVTKLIDP